MNTTQVRLRVVRADDVATLAAFRCSSGMPWEDAVESQVRGPLPYRYLASPPVFDGRMLLGFGPDDRLLVVGAHHIEPTLVPDVGYAEVIAVSSDARGLRVRFSGGRLVTLGEFMLLSILRQMRQLGRHPRTFARIDRRNTRSLALCDRVGLREERPDPNDRDLVQRWGELPR